MTYQPPAPPQRVKGPQWVKGAKVGDKYYFDGEFWQIQSVSNRGREITWYNTNDGRKGTTIVHPAHLDYPPDPTDAELKAEARAKLERLRAERYRYY